MNGETRTVFIVDDAREVRKSLSRVLAAAEYRVRTFGSAESFLEGEHTDAPGCLLLDNCLPGPKLLLNDNNAGKPEGIHEMIGRRPHAAFGNSTGDQQMLEYTKAGEGARLSMLVLHDDATREYAYGPAQGLPETKVRTFTQALYNEAMKDGWIVISMKSDWKRIFAFD
jgi:DNA-binding NarL/FixJ family response regulator